MLKDRVDDFFSRLEWRWSLANMLWGLGAVSSAALPAWAVSAMSTLSAYAPLSWVVAGFVGFFCFVVCFYIYGLAKSRVVSARFNSRSLSRGGYFKPNQKTISGERIFLNDFILPSTPFLQDKEFVDCEIIGQCNIFLSSGNNISRSMLPNCDAVVIRSGVDPFNCIRFINCIFIRCSFQRVTFFISTSEYDGNKEASWINWISFLPDSEMPLLNMEPSEAIEDKTNDEP